MNQHVHIEPRVEARRSRMRYIVTMIVLALSDDVDTPVTTDELIALTVQYAGQSRPRVQPAEVQEVLDSTLKEALGF